MSRSRAAAIATHCRIAYLDAGLAFARAVLMTSGSTRWSHLVRHGLIGTSLLGATALPAVAEPCDDDESQVVALVLGVDLSPRMRLVGGIEGRACIDERSEAMVRLELGGGAPRLIAGARLRPFERNGSDNDREQLGIEGGLVLDTHSQFGLHAAATLGTHSAYAAFQALVPANNTTMQGRFSLLAGLAPWALADGGIVVEGRPLCVGGRFVRPRLAGPPNACASREGRAVRDHYIDSAQLELSSVWTFLRLARELAAVGAPAALVVAALDAADDEVRHAELCAAAAGGVALVALPMEAARPRFTSRSAHALAVLAAEAWHEGCLNETAAAEEARLAARDADGDMRAMLATIAADEQRHAELSWSVLAWIVAIDPALAAVMVAPAERGDAASPLFDRALARHGVPSPSMKASARAHAREVAAARAS
jgi:hypothetical protein